MVRPTDNVECEEDQIIYKCEPMISTLCKTIYNETTVPGFSNTLSQEEALTEFRQFKPLIDYKCSPDLLPLLCSFYFPVCTILPVPIPPCRKLCLSAKSTCEPILINFGFEWPVALSCSSFPMNENGLCVGQNTSTETKPSVTSVTGTATSNWNLPATGVTVSVQNLNKIRNEWNSHQGNFNEHPVFLLLSTMHDIVLYDMATNDLIKLYSGIDQGASVDFHFRKQWIYWANCGESRIYRGHLVLDRLRKIEVVADAVSPTIESIAVDWVSDHIFWLESYPSKIRVAALDGSNPTTLMDNRLTNPKSMILDPIKGFLFWIDMTGDLYSPSAYIERYELNKSKHEVIFNITGGELAGMGRPLGLTVDRINHMLYWVDAKSESVQRVDYDGRNYEVVLSKIFYSVGNGYVQFLSEPRGLAIYGSDMYWTDVHTQTIATAKTDGTRLRRLKNLTDAPPMDIKVFHKYQQPNGTVPYDIHLTEAVSGTYILSTNVLFLVFSFVMHVEYF